MTKKFVRRLWEVSAFSNFAARNTDLETGWQNNAVNARPISCFHLDRCFVSLDASRQIKQANRQLERHRPIMLRHLEEPFVSKFQKVCLKFNQLLTKFFTRADSCWMSQISSCCAAVHQQEAFQPFSFTKESGGKNSRTTNFLEKNPHQKTNEDVRYCGCFF